MCTTIKKYKCWDQFVSKNQISVREASVPYPHPYCSLLWAGYFFSYNVGLFAFSTITNSQMFLCLWLSVWWSLLLLVAHLLVCLLLYTKMEHFELYLFLIWSPYKYFSKQLSDKLKTGSRIFDLVFSFLKIPQNNWWSKICSFWFFNLSNIQAAFHWKCGCGLKLAPTRYCNMFLFVI